MSDFFHLPFKVLWRYCFVRMDRAVPVSVTKITSEPPYPYVEKLPSRTAHKIPVHITIPSKLTEGYDGPHAVHIDFHGGGFFMGSCLEQAPFCSMIAEKLGRIVISVDYRMGPIHKFPAALHDAEDVVLAVLEPASAAGTKLRRSIWEKMGYKTPPASADPKSEDMETDILDPTRLSLSGFSSGGNLALNLAIGVSTDKIDWPSPLAKYATRPIPTLLFYPSFDQTVLPHQRTPLETMTPNIQARITKQSRLGLSRVLSETYLSAEQRMHPRASPGNAPLEDMLPGTKIFLVLCEIDTLAKQSEEWVSRVQKEGKVKMVQVERCEGMRHGWTQIPDFALSDLEKKEKVKVFRKAAEFLARF